MSNPPQGCAINTEQENITSNYVLLQSTDTGKNVYGKVSDWLNGQQQGNSWDWPSSNDWGYWSATPGTMQDVGCFVWSDQAFIQNTDPHATCTASGTLGPDILWTSTDDGYLYTQKPANTTGYYCGWTGLYNNEFNVSFASADDGNNGKCTAAFLGFDWNPPSDFLPYMNCYPPSS
jgi:hypothetical protein